MHLHGCPSLQKRVPGSAALCLLRCLGARRRRYSCGCPARACSPCWDCCSSLALCFRLPARQLTYSG